MIAICRALIGQHIKICLRSGYMLLAVAFLFIMAILLPFGVGAELTTLRQLAPGLLWVVLAIAVLLSLEHLFHSDFEDGSLEQIFLLTIAPELAIFAKMMGHFIAIALPLVLAMPFAGILLNLDAVHLLPLLANMLAGAAALTFLGGLGAALAVSVRRGAMLMVLMVMPFYVPILIIGAGATHIALDTALAGGTALIHFLILAGLSIATGLLTPFAIVAALRAGWR